MRIAWRLVREVRLNVENPGAATRAARIMRAMEQRSRRDYNREYCREWRARNRAKVNEYNKRWMREYRKAQRRKAKVKE
jgi:hypothetical protein